MTNSRSLPASIAHLFEPYVRRETAIEKAAPTVVEIQPIMRLIREAVGDDCSICGEPIDFECRSNDPMRPSVEHVFPKSMGGVDGGNRLLAHKMCNWQKGNRMPTGCEVIRLYAANAVLGGIVAATGTELAARNQRKALAMVERCETMRCGGNLNAGEMAELAKLLRSLPCKEIIDGE